jgi:hypothetical protein
MALWPNSYIACFSHELEGSNLTLNISFFNDYVMESPSSDEVFALHQVFPPPSLQKVDEPWQQKAQNDDM